MRRLDPRNQGNRTAVACRKSKRPAGAGLSEAMEAEEGSGAGDLLLLGRLLDAAAHLAGLGAELGGRCRQQVGVDAAALLDGADGAGGEAPLDGGAQHVARSEEHTSELQSLMRTSSAVFCL